MTTYHDALCLDKAGICANCKSLARRLIKGRCGTCYKYWAKFCKERPPESWQPARCDCKKLATQTLTLPIAGRGEVTLLLCDDCAAEERSLSPTHSWAGE